MKNLIQNIQKAILNFSSFHNKIVRSRLKFTIECKETQQNANQLRRYSGRSQTEEN